MTLKWVEIDDLYLDRFHTFSSGFLDGKDKLEYNYTQLITCTINQQEHRKMNKAPVQHVKQLSTLSTYRADEEMLQWSIEPILESKDSWTCPEGFELRNSLCQECQSCHTTACETGYRRNSQSGLCEDIDECTLHGNLCQYMCENQPGSYRCYCPIGFKLNESGHCQDINECDQFQIDCGQDRRCFNTRGAYECIDIPCPVGYIRQNDTSCLSKCHQRLSSACPPRRPIHIRYEFLAVPRLTPSKKTLFTLPLIHHQSHSLKLLDKTYSEKSFPFVLNGFDLQTNRSLIETNEYQFDIHVHYQSDRKIRSRFDTIFHVHIHVSPFHF